MLQSPPAARMSLATIRNFLGHTIFACKILKLVGSPSKPNKEFPVCAVVPYWDKRRELCISPTLVHHSSQRPCACHLGETHLPHPNYEATKRELKGSSPSRPHSLPLNLNTSKSRYLYGLMSGRLCNVRGRDFNLQDRLIGSLPPSLSKYSSPWRLRETLSTKIQQSGLCLPRFSTRKGTIWRCMDK